MNAAFRRGQAIDSLESLALVIVEHIFLVSHFSDHSAVNHWKSELGGFQKAIHRFNRGKKGRSNFTTEGVAQVLEDIIRDDEEKESLIALIESSKDMPVGEIDEVDWDIVRSGIQRFAESTLSK